MLRTGGLDDSQALDAWGCVYLTPEEIGEILGLVKVRAEDGYT